MTIIAAGRAKLRGPAGEGLPPAAGRGPVNGEGPGRSHDDHHDGRDDDRDPAFYDQDRL
jgi:hypothetical protein